VSPRSRLLPFLVALGLAAPVSAHDGPPYAVIVDQPFGDRTVSIWADPDVGTGTFYLYLEPAEDATSFLPLEIHARPREPRWTPSDAEFVLASANAPYQLLGEIAFEARGTWDVEFVQPATGATTRLEIEVTPPGSLGPIDLLWFAFPFLAVAGLWIKGLLRQRAHRLSES